MDNNKLIITPHTKVLQLIEAYPQLEDALTGYIPAFSKLKNPALRNTVAKIATLRQAAAVGNVDVAELINFLRKKAGQDNMQDIENSDYNSKKPLWYNEQNIIKEFDVREMLAAGEHPVGQVISDLGSFQEGMIYKLIAPFLPAPLIDKATSLGYSHWVETKEDALFYIYFTKDNKL